MFITALFTPPVFGLIMIDEEIEQYTDVNTNNFFEEEIKSHDLQLFNRINAAPIHWKTTIKKQNFNLHSCLDVLTSYLDAFYPPPELLM